MFGRRTPKEPPEERKASDVRAAESDIRLAYRLILGREPDAEGARHYRERIDEGLLLNELIESLLGSSEYRERATRRIDPLGPGDAAPPRTPPGSIGSDSAIRPSDVIVRHGVEQLIETAEEYYRRIPDATPLMSKPWSFLHETPEMLENLGHLFGGLALGKGMIVLDFGAGTCWLSRCLAQLNCRPICCDASRSALEIGRRLFVEHPVIGPAVYEPTFLLFDGHRIDLPNESVDRIVCFDAFHHVPNQDEVLAEFGRVLKDGGVAGFSEPGPHHSQSPQSQYEMRHHRVLENDIDVAAIFRLAQRAGFTDVTLKALTSLELNLVQYSTVLSGAIDDALAGHIQSNVRDTLTARSIFFLHKGALRRDSRSHEGLRHSLEVARRDYRLSPGEPLVVDVVARNTGDAKWLHAGEQIFGLVRVGTHLYSVSGELLNLDHSRHDLPAPVEPGSAVHLTIEIPLPAPAAYRVVIDLVAEGVSWFENLGSTPVVVTVSKT